MLVLLNIPLSAHKVYLHTLCCSNSLFEFSFSMFSTIKLFKCNNRDMK